MANDLDMNRIPQHIAIIMDGNGRCLLYTSDAADE
mgnify:CR=1 FL=1